MVAVLLLASSAYNTTNLVLWLVDRLEVAVSLHYPNEIRISNFFNKIKRMGLSHKVRRSNHLLLTVLLLRILVWYFKIDIYGEHLLRLKARKRVNEYLASDHDKKKYIA